MEYKILFNGKRYKIEIMKDGSGYGLQNTYLKVGGTGM